MAVMDQQEHIATLCAAGTVGIAAAGFALGTEDRDVYTVTPGKRKQPGASSTKSPVISQVPLAGRRTVSQPAPSAAPLQGKSQISLTNSLFRRKTVRDNRPYTANQSDTTESRDSSLNRSGASRPRTADTRTTSERRDTSTGSSWLKRISTVSSSIRSNSPSASLRQKDGNNNQNLTPLSVSAPMSNKLVKRSTSQRAISNDHARGSFLRRPATSHQRTATLQSWELQQSGQPTSVTSTLMQTVLDTDSSSPPIWRPFFERGYPRKRHSTGGVREFQPLRTVVTPSHVRPTLVLGPSIEPVDVPDDSNDNPDKIEPALPIKTTNRQRLRRSLSSMHRPSRRRYFTEPIVKVSDETANGTISSAVQQSPLSPMSNVSTFDIELPQGSPVFTSSPTFIPVRHRFSFRKRQSTVPSDPTTISSDNDTRVFTDDDDSMDFQSDSAYDSLATRATVSSHSAMRPSKLDTIFNDVPVKQSNDHSSAGLEQAMQKISLNESRQFYPDTVRESSHNYGIGISGIEDEDNDEIDVRVQESKCLTPRKSASIATDDMSATPVPIKFGLDDATDQYHSDSTRSQGIGGSTFGEHPRLNPDNEDEDNIDWSPISNMVGRTPHLEFPLSSARTLSNICSSPVLSQYDHDSFFEDDQTSADRRLSIFDWSEQQPMTGDSTHGGEARPKTVHGKQVNDNSRSRSSGRKLPNQLHLRSQSVPNNRESPAESTSLSSSKFSTWGLGHKPVSEEWSDDFEFDDVEEEAEEIPQLAISSAESINRGSIRVPQSIIDRQASVHLQFGQVQEFMLLVEELKRLRARGGSLDLIHNHSKQLWDDAESIINLATINDEEDETEDVEPRSPVFPDFGDEMSTATKKQNVLANVDESKRILSTQRSFSNPATPPHGRPRGESLAQAKNFLHTIHQSRNQVESSPMSPDDQPLKKLPFDTQDLKDLVIRSGVITRALKEIVRKAEGVSVSPTKTPPKPREPRDPPFSQIFTAPDVSPCPPFRHPGLPKSHSAHSYLSGNLERHHNNGEVPTAFTTLSTAMCNS